MGSTKSLFVVASLGVAIPLWAQGGGGAGRGAGAPPVDLTVPSDLRSLLAPRRSEMRLVAVRYTADRQLLTTNYAGTGGGNRSGGRGGRAGGAAPIMGGQQADSAAAAAVDSAAAGRSGGRGAGRGNADSTVTP